MAINILQYAQLFQKWLDEVMIARGATGWMEANAGQVVYIGGATIQIPKIVMDGMGNYDKDNGYVQGGVTLSYEAKNFTQDRGRKFQLDLIQSDDTAKMATAYNVMEQFQRTKVIPEIDAYRHAVIATAAIAQDAGSGSNARTYTPATADVYATLKNDIALIQDVIGEDYPLVIAMSISANTILSESDKITKFLNVQEFPVGGNIKTKVQFIDDIPIIRVPSARMNTAITLNDGVTAGQTGGGFATAAGAKAINWMIMARTAPIAVSKADTIRIFDPMVNQKANAWGFDYRRYHDIWIPDNKLPSLFCNHQ
ncbi:MAG: hypothetical protein P4N59_25245 [Negativicutes bacterium]|nr:hypothetical protein [Negativicutes bacterium]